MHTNIRKKFMVCTDFIAGNNNLVKEFPWPDQSGTCLSCLDPHMSYSLYHYN